MSSRGTWTERERELLEAAREPVPTALEARMRAALDQQLGAASATRLATPGSRWFGSKLPLWGTLGMLALGSATFLGVRVASPPAARPPLAASPSSAAVSVGEPQPPGSGDAAVSSPASAALEGGRQLLGAADEASPALEGGRQLLGAADAASSPASAAPVGSRQPLGAANAASAALEGGRQPLGSADEVPSPAALVGSRQLLGAADAASSPASVAPLRGLQPLRAADEASAALVGGRQWLRAADVAPMSAALVGGRRPLGAADAAPSSSLLGARQPLTAAADAPLQSASARADEVHRLDAAHLWSPTASVADLQPPTGVNAAAQSSAAHAEPGSPSANDRLRLEAELLAGARLALSQGALPRAEQLLQRYADQYEPGALQPESEVLAIELHIRKGDKLGARAEAQRFLATYREHPLRERVRSLVKR